MLLNFFVETLINFFQDSLMDRKFKRTDFFELEIFCNIVTNLISMLNKTINFFQKKVLLTPNF